MRRRLPGILVVLLTGAAVAAWAQQGQPRPGPGSGVVSVNGTVTLANAPGTTKEGDWRVAVANTPSVNVANTPYVSFAPLAFVTPGKRYQITWPSGETEQITAAATGRRRLGTGRWPGTVGQPRAGTERRAGAIEHARTPSSTREACRMDSRGPSLRYASADTAAMSALM